jgi:hypothetical protein
MVFGGGGAAATVARSIDNTTRVLAGLRYSDPLQSFSLELSASLFRNGKDTLTVQNR